MNAGNQARQSAIAYSKSLEQMTFGTKAATIASKALAAAGNMIVFALVAKGVELAVKAISNYINRVHIAEDAMNDTVAAHESAKSSLESINSELETQNTKIKELQSKDPLTYVEHDQLKELQAVTQELLIQQDLAQ